jgi:hypothetical protein
MHLVARRHPSSTICQRQGHGCLEGQLTIPRGSGGTGRAPDSKDGRNIAMVAADTIASAWNSSKRSYQYN